MEWHCHVNLAKVNKCPHCGDFHLSLKSFHAAPFAQVARRKQRKVKLDMGFQAPKTPENAAAALAKIKMKPHPLRIAGSILLPTNLQQGQGFSSLQLAVDTWRRGQWESNYSCTIPNASLKGQRPIDVNGWKNLSRTWNGPSWTIMNRHFMLKI